jgi:hypothetical protein
MKFFKGDRLEARYQQACGEYETHAKEHKELEDALTALNPTTIPFYHRLYEERGGEQFRPDPSKFTCK